MQQLRQAVVEAHQPTTTGDTIKMKKTSIGRVAVPKLLNKNSVNNPGVEYGNKFSGK